MRNLKKLFIYTTVIGALIVSIMVVFGFIYQDEVVNSVKTEINKHLNAEIKVSHIEFSLFNNFPLASVTLYDVVGFESKNYTKQPDTLFAFKEFSLSFNVIDILNESYVLNHIHAIDGFLNLEIDKHNEGNYEIFVTEADSSTTFQLDLESVHLEKCEVAFTDFSTSDRYRFYFPNIIANGTFSGDQINTALYGSTIVKDLILEDTPYLKNELAKIDVGVAINTKSGSFQVSRGFITLRTDYDFDVKGKTQHEGFRYTFESKMLDLVVLEDLIPEKHKQFLEAYDITGQSSVFLEIKRSKHEGHPSISGKYNVINGGLKYIETGEAIQIPKAVGTFNMGNRASAETMILDVTDFQISARGTDIQGQFYLLNLKHPNYKIKANGTADLLELTNMVSFGEGFKMSGTTDFAISISGAVEDIDSITVKDIKTIIGSGNFKLNNGVFTISNIPSISGVDALFMVNKQEVIFENLTGKIGHSQVQGKMKLDHWLDFILDDSRKISIYGDLGLDKFLVSDWQSDSPSNTEEEFSFPRRVKFMGNISVGEFNYEKLILTNISAHSSLNNGTLKLKDAYINGFDGELVLDIQMKEYLNKISYSGNLRTKNVKVQSLLRSFNEFGQKALTSKEIRGDFNSNLTFRFFSDKKFEINTSSIYLDGDVVMLNGELKEYKLLYEIPKEIESNKIIGLFVNLDRFEKSLHHIKFDTIQNHITIENSIIHIPRMDIHSSALGISLQGTHSFENEIDYYMNFNIKEVLSKKEPIKSEYGYIEDDALGNRMIYLHVYTKNGELEVDLDKLGTKKSSNKSNEELQVAKSILKEELGLYKNDTSVVVSEKEAVFEYELDMGEFSDSNVTDTVLKADTVSADSGVFHKLLKKKKKKKKTDEDFEEWDFEDDDY
jgi:hypothetical protein